MAPTLYHGLNALGLGLPVTCIESREAYQALKSLGTHETDRNERINEHPLDPGGP